VESQELLERRGRAVEDFDRHGPIPFGPSDGCSSPGGSFHGAGRVIESLSAGLSQLRDILYTRIHDDVERRIGMDSMMMAVSEEKSRQLIKQEIEIFQIVNSAAAVHSRSYLPGDDSWYLGWLTEYRLGDVHNDARVVKRLDFYRLRSPSEQRLAFSNALMAILPEARRAPLIMYRLVPPAVRIVTALAFGKTADAQECRREQAEHLPSILDCHHCHGTLLENGESCSMCGNPLWNYEWLTASDD
jgi:hypothetical protein